MTRKRAIITGIIALIVLPGPGWVVLVTILALRGCA